MKYILIMLCFVSFVSSKNLISKNYQLEDLNPEEKKSLERFKGKKKVVTIEVKNEVEQYIDIDIDGELVQFKLIQEGKTYKGYQDGLIKIFLRKERNNISGRINLYGNIYKIHSISDSIQVIETTKSKPFKCGTEETQ